MLSIIVNSSDSSRGSRPDRGAQNRASDQEEYMRRSSYLTSKLHKSPVKHRFIAGYIKCTTKQLSNLSTKIITVIKIGLEKYCSIKTSHTEVNNMWIPKNSTNLLSSLGHLGAPKATSIQTFNLISTLHTSIPHDLLKSRMNKIINNAFKHKNGATRYTHIKKLAEIKGTSPMIL